MATINQRQLILELKTIEPILVREATRIFEENYFTPAVEKLNEEFEASAITQEIDLARDDITTPSISGTVVGGESTEAKNLYAFIGFEAGENPTDEIRKRLIPGNPDGPSYKYIRGSQVDNIVFDFTIKGPNLDAIYEKTPMPWAPGLSWAERIEKGIPGLSKFLNKVGIASSRSGGGIQTKNNIRTANFKPKKYLSTMMNNFIKNFTG